MKNSFWRQQAESVGANAPDRYPPLNESIEVDVAIVGGGITGLSTALELLYRGKQVAVLESDTIGSGTTGRSSGHLDTHPEIGPRKLLSNYGRDVAKKYIQLRRNAITAIESRAIVEARFKAIPAYMYTENYRDLDSLKDEFDAALDIGLLASWQDNIPLSHAAFGYRIDGMARMNSLQYARGLADLVSEAGGRIYEQTFVQPPLGSDAGVVQTDGGVIRCENVVCAVHSNYTDSLRLYLQTPPYQSYIMAARVNDPPPDALYWDNASPYFYARRASDDDPNLLIVGGCDHRTGNGHATESMLQLEQYAKERYQVEEIVSSWSAELFEPTDGLPMIGRISDHGSSGKGGVWIGTGFSGIGLTWGTVAGWMIADQIIGKQTPLEDELSPNRFGTTGIGKMASAQTTAVASYSQRVRPAETVDPETLANGEGNVGNVDGKFVAVCRDQSGCLHTQSPICTHQGGVLHWNDVEQTWDCPVHGGRFAPDGSRIYGPPSADLPACETAGKGAANGRD